LKGDGWNNNTRKEWFCWGI